MNRISGWIKRHWLALAIAAVGVLVFAGAGFLGYRTRQGRLAAAIEPPPTVAVNRGDVVLSVTAPGLSISTNTQVLSSRVDGRVEEILVQPGEVVKAGQTLVSLGDRESFTSVAIAARLTVLQAQSALDELRANAPQRSALVQQAVEQAQQASENIDQSAEEERSQAQLALAEAQTALIDARRKRERMDQPHTSDPLVIEKAEADYLLAKQAYKDALKEFNRHARKKLTNMDRVRTLNLLLAARQEMEQRLATYNWYLLGYSEEEIAQADAEVAVANANLEKTQADWDRLKDGVSTTASLLAQAGLAAAQRDAARLNNGSEPVAIEIAQATIAEAQSAQVEAEANSESLEIQAPFDGIILNIPIQTGQTVGPGTALVVLLDPKAIQVRATVVEEDLPLITPGQPVNLFFDALPEANVSGKLDRIIPQRDSDTLAIFPIYIRLDQVPQHLAAGMTVDASIIIAERLGVLRLPRALVHAHSDGTADVDVWLNGQVDHRTIQVGLRGDSFVEIIDGLNEGEMVVAQ